MTVSGNTVLALGILYLSLLVCLSRITVGVRFVCITAAANVVNVVKNAINGEAVSYAPTCYRSARVR